MSLIHNERTKLTATWFNTLATALVGAGAFAPLAALFYGLTEFRRGGVTTLVLAAGCLALGGSLHMLARAFLGRLRP